MECSVVSKADALRKLSRKEAGRSDFLLFQKQVQARYNDRGACILLSSNVENALDAALYQLLHIRDGQFASITEQDGPLATFSRTITMAYALDILGEKTHKSLTIIRHVRNVFAHAKVPISFKTPEVVAICDDLNIIDGLYQHMPHKPPDKATLSSRQLFEEICNSISTGLFTYSLASWADIDRNALKIPIENGFDVFMKRVPLP
jgi:DNA-binding MltR family transcriptional regulator